MHLQQKIEAAEERSLQSTDRCLGLIYESEQIGVSTAEELLHQREHLQNVERKVDDVNATLKTTQKHLNSIKSIFGGIKNYFSTPSIYRPSRREADYQVDSSALQGVVQQLKSKSTSYSPMHPGLRIRGLDDATNDDENDEQHQWNQSMPTTPHSQRRSRLEEIEAKLDANLAEISAGIAKLKELALGLGNEITEQTAIICRITEKTESGECNIRRQNDQLRKIIGR